MRIKRGSMGVADLKSGGSVGSVKASVGSGRGSVGSGRGSMGVGNL